MSRDVGVKQAKQEDLCYLPIARNIPQKHSLAAREIREGNLHGGV